MCGMLINNEYRVSIVLISSGRRHSRAITEYAATSSGCAYETSSTGDSFSVRGLGMAMSSVAGDVINIDVAGGVVLVPVQVDGRNFEILISYSTQGVQFPRLIRLIRLRLRPWA
jgi:hypothetical protein